MRLGLLGYPLGHSLSPAMHTAALAAAGLSDWRYAALPTPPEHLAAAVAALRAGDFAGVNVTVPHKEAVLPLLDALTPEAKAIGAVNTIVAQPAGGAVHLLGDNTDAAGLLADLRACAVHLERHRVLILGAGGAARAAVAACLAGGAQVRVVARRRAQAEALNQVGRVTHFPWTRLGLMQAAENCRLVINCTPLGMAPQVDASPWLDSVAWPSRAFIYDLVYNPSETRFIHQARRAGLEACTGLGMLVEQGALAFELWTGQTAPRAVMRAAAERALAAAPAP
ncbi:MAG: shikimate dehydrogenase [Anaerolineales bacterium]|nr:shikimate dehydrogenase [Anaerolineales bacterium]